MLVAKRSPFDDLVVSESVPLRKYHEQAFDPERSDIAVAGLAHIWHERDVKLPLANQ